MSIARAGAEAQSGSLNVTSCAVPSASIVSASVALSRVVLGLHYPSDVLAATGIGVLLAGLSLWLVPGVSLLG